MKNYNRLMSYPMYTVSIIINLKTIRDSLWGKIDDAQ